MRNLLLYIGAGVLVSACASHKPVALRFNTPDETFETWKEAALQLDIKSLVSTYSRSTQNAMMEELTRTSQQELNQMKAETKKTKFKVEKVVFEGDRAFLRVHRRVGNMSEIEVLNMIRENGEWKIVP